MGQAAGPGPRNANSPRQWVPRRLDFEQHPKTASLRIQAAENVVAGEGSSIAKARSCVFLPRSILKSQFKK